MKNLETQLISVKLIVGRKEEKKESKAKNGKKNVISMVIVLFHS